MQWSAWLQDYEPSKPKSKAAANKKTNEVKSAENERRSNDFSNQPIVP
jgi:hypothetical protein